MMERQWLTRYTIVKRRTLFWFAAACGVLGLLFLTPSLYIFFGSIEERGETRDPTDAERAFACVDALIAFWMFACVIHFMVAPSTIEARQNGTIAIVRLIGRKTVPIRDIRAIDWWNDRQILTIKHGRRSTVLSPFNDAAEFVSDVRWLKPNVVVTVTGPTGKSSDSNSSDNERCAYKAGEKS